MKRILIIITYFIIGILLYYISKIMIEKLSAPYKIIWEDESIINVILFSFTTSLIPVMEKSLISSKEKVQRITLSTIPILTGLIVILIMPFQHSIMAKGEEIKLLMLLIIPERFITEYYGLGVAFGLTSIGIFKLINNNKTYR